MSTDDIVIVAAARTPQGRLKGQLASFTAPQLGGFAIAGARAGRHSAEAVDAASWGRCCRPVPDRTRRARRPRRRTRLGRPGIRVNKVCLSGLTAIIDAKRMIASGDARVVVAGGMESMTRAPHLLMGSREGWSYGSVEVLDHMAYDGLTDAYDRESMGASTERLNPRFEVTREQQDRVAALSHQRAAAARDAGSSTPRSSPSRWRNAAVPR
jgi:acetyl-CoA C-acetyltransferase